MGRYSNVSKSSLEKNINIFVKHSKKVRKREKKLF